jgi:hypothetical protein
LAVLTAAVSTAAVLTVVSPTPAQAMTDNELMKMMKEDDRWAPVDYGPGPGKPRPDRYRGWNGWRSGDSDTAADEGGTSRAAATEAATATPLATPAAPVAAAALAATTAGGVPAGGTAAAREGVFGPAETWPIIPVHAVLLPDGRVLNYGTDETGTQGGHLIYALWNPKQGLTPGAHTVLPNGTATDIFCSAQSLLSRSGEVLISGGDRTIAGARNYSTEETTVFNPNNEALRRGRPMAFARWYPAIVPLPNGEVLVMGGRESKNPTVTTNTPEIYNVSTGWRTLTGARNDELFTDSWYYTRSYLAPNGRVLAIANTGALYWMAVAGAGSVSKLAQSTLPSSSFNPMTNFAPGKLLAVRDGGRVVVIDIRGAAPTVTETAGLGQVRAWANLSVLADGKVLLTGGSAQANKLVGVTYRAEIWNPANGRWTPGASAAKARLYHSISLLLPDGSVLTGGGGAPGPLRNMNAEIYYPGYLYRKDNSGQPAERPVVLAAPAAVRLGQAFTVRVGAGDLVSRVTLVRTGSTTHSYDPDQRFFTLGHTQTGAQLRVTAPTNRNVAVPGYYMLFVFNRQGTPALARILRVTL